MGVMRDYYLCSGKSYAKNSNNSAETAWKNSRIGVIFANLSTTIDQPLLVHTAVARSPENATQDQEAIGTVALPVVPCCMAEKGAVLK